MNKKLIKKIAATLKLDEAALEAEIQKAEGSDELVPDGLLAFTPSEIESRDKVVDKKAFDRGSETSMEVFVKTKKRELGLEFEGKDPEKLIEALSAKVLSDAKVTPDKSLAEKDKTIEGLRRNIAALEEEKSNIASTLNTVKRQTTLLKSIPQNLISGVEPEEVLLTMGHKGFEFDEMDGQLVVKKNGQVVADQALRPLPVKDVITGYVKERNWLDDEQSGQREGRAGGHSKMKDVTTKPTKLSEAEAQWTASGKNTGTAEFQQHLRSLTADNKDFDLDS